MKVKLLQYSPEPQKSCAIAARLCYSADGIDEIAGKLSQEKVEVLLKKVISSGHTSVLEHASFSFGIEGVSRALLAQLTRHRIASFSVQSQRYVKFNAVEFVTPKSISKEKVLLDKYEKFLKTCQDLYQELLSSNVPAEDARYILPNASTTKITLTMNARELRHFFSLRCCNRAQWEIRDLACQMLGLVRQVAPVLFGDAGPDCVRGGCEESSPCGSPWVRMK
jgi:thymidylate synthase (FAD)